MQGFDEFVYAMFRHMYVLFLIGFPSTSLSCKAIYLSYIYWKLRKYFSIVEVAKDFLSLKALYQVPFHNMFLLLFLILFNLDLLYSMMQKAFVD